MTDDHRDDDEPGEVMPGYDQPSDAGLSEEARRKLAPAADEDEIPPENDEL
jgi:hypothetical protein